MNKIEYLLTCISEEGGEITQAASKCIRFGLDSPSRISKESMTNLQQLITEVNDVIAIISMLHEEGLDISLFMDANQIANKQNKVNFYMQDSIREGLLEHPKEFTVFCIYDIGHTDRIFKTRKAALEWAQQTCVDRDIDFNELCEDNLIHIVERAVRM